MKLVKSWVQTANGWQTRLLKFLPKPRMFTASPLKLPDEMAARLLKKPLYRAGAMVAAGAVRLALVPLALGLPVLVSLASLRRSHLHQARAELPSPQQVTLTRWPDRIEEVRSGKTVIMPDVLKIFVRSRGTTPVSARYIADVAHPHSG